MASSSSSSLLLRREKPAEFYSLSKVSKPKPVLLEFLLYLRSLLMRPKTVLLGFLIYLRGLLGIAVEDQDEEGTECARIVRMSSHQMLTDVAEMAIADSVSNSVTIASYNHITGTLEEESLLPSSSLTNLKTTSSSSIGNQKPIFCIKWLRYTETLLLGTKGGVLRYNLKSSDNYTRVFYAHPTEKDVYEVETSPVGRYFCFAAKGDRVLTVCDQLIRGAVSTVHCMRGSRYLPGSLTWSMEGQIVVLATEANEIIALDTSFWRHQSCGQLIGMKKITSMSWLSPTVCIFATNLLSENHQYPSVSTIQFDIGADSTVNMTSFTPSNLIVDMDATFDIIGGNADFNSTDYTIDRMTTDSHGKFLAMSFCDRNDGSILPYIVVFLFQTIPTVALTPFTCLSGNAPRRPITYDSSHPAPTFPTPQSMEFLHTSDYEPTKLVVCYSHNNDLNNNNNNNNNNDNNDASEDIVENNMETIEVIVTEINPRPAYHRK